MGAIVAVLSLLLSGVTLLRPEVALAAGGQSFTTLAAGYSQEIWGTAPDMSFLAGIAFASNGDVLASNCQGDGYLRRFSGSNTTTVNGTTLHAESKVLSAVGCGL